MNGGANGKPLEGGVEGVCSGTTNRGVLSAWTVCMVRFLRELLTNRTR